MINFDQNTHPQLSPEIFKQIHSIELKKATMIYTSSHIDKLLGNLNDLLIKHCGIYPFNNANFVSRQYSLYITSGNDESNKNLIYGAIASFRRITKNKPHIIMCETDNAPLINYLNQIKINNEAEIDLISINVQGNSITKIIEKSIQPNKTCLIIIGYVNSIFGSINNIKKIGELAHKYKIPLHVNCNYIFGQIKINPYENNMDSFVIDFSQIGGIKNFGILGIKKDLLYGYQLDKSVKEFTPIIDNSKIDPISLQIANNTISALYNNKKSRLSRQKKIRTTLLKSLKKYYHIISLMDWLKGSEGIAGKRTIVILFIGSDSTLFNNNILSLIPVDFSEEEHKKLSQLANYDYIDKLIIQHYKTIFKDVFKKSEKKISVLDHIYTLSWNDRISNTELTNFIKQMTKI
jgi:hypothetical protein